MKTTATAIAVLACVGVLLAAERDHKAHMFPPTNFGMLIPSGFSRDDQPRTGPDFKSWVFTNAAGSRLTFVVGGHWNPTGTKTDFKGFAAFESGTNLIRQIAFDSAGFSHAELEKIGRSPQYDARIEYRAASTEDQKSLDASIESFFVGEKPESNQAPEDTSLRADPQR
jgi:hypothetical protein